MKYIFFLFGCLLSFVVCAGSNNKLSVNNIDKALYQNANAVIRNFSMTIIIKSNNEAYITKEYAVTVLNENGQKYGNIKIEYSDAEKIEAFSGQVYDKDGNKIKEIKNADFRSQPLFPYAGYYDDCRIKRFKYGTRQYPYTVQFTVEIKQNTLFYLPAFDPQEDIDCAVEEATLSVKMPAEIKLNYKAFGLDEYKSTKDDNLIVHTWHVKHINATKNEPLSYRGIEDAHVALLSCTYFSVGKFSGNQSTWKDFGKFSYELNRGRGKLPDSLRQRIKMLLRGINDRNEKINALYRYLQQNMRYVAIEYGIGGWQTMEASDVARTQYGDCKALSNFMMALLNDAGIESYPVLIYAGEPFFKLIRDFPCGMFNHVILCIPQPKDTVWFECTSNELPANYLSSFTEDRDALMITPEGGVIVHTPKYDSSVNIIMRHAIAQPHDVGDLSVTMNIVSKGEFGLNVLHSVQDKPAQVVDQYASNKLHLTNYRVKDYKFRRDRNNSDLIINEDLQLIANNMITQAGKQTFLNYDLAPIVIELYSGSDERKTPFYLSQSYCIRDTFEIELPPNTVIDFVPEPVSLSYVFGCYDRVVEKYKDRIIITRCFVQNKGIYDAKLFSQYSAWLDDIARDADKIALTSQN